MTRSHLIWMLRQLFPLHYRTTYLDERQQRHYAVWRMWWGRVFAHDDVVVRSGTIECRCADC
jgi:hypothetical protein